MGKEKRNCDYCEKEYMADTRNLKRGWGLCCSKSCAANKREKSKPNYNPVRVAENNWKRENYGRELWAKRRGYPSFADFENDQLEEDGSWDAHGGVELSICKICELRANHCRCGEGNWY